MLVFYFLSILVVFLGVVVGLPGAVHINPILLHFFEPHIVTFLTTALLLMTSASSIIIFWKYIQWKDALLLAFYGLLGGVAGGLLFGYLSPRVVVLLFFVSGFAFLWNHYHKKPNTNKYGLFVSGFLTSFLQSFGVSAGAIRRTFLLTKGYSLQEIYGTIAIAYTVSGGSIVVTRMVHEDIPFALLYQILVLFPFIFITVFIGKKMMGLFSKRVQEYIVVYSLIVSLILAIPYLFK